MLKRLAPYLIAAAALLWVLWRTNLAKLGESFKHAPMGWFVAIAAVLLVLNLLADTFAMSTVFRWFGCEVRYGDLVVVRGATYLLAVVNYHVGQAAVLGYLYRTRKVPLATASGWILFIIGINVGTLLLLASIGVIAGHSLRGWLQLVPAIFAPAVVLYAILLLVKPRFLAERAPLAPLFQMGISGHLKGLLVRLPHVGVLIVWHWLCLRMFGARVPPLVAVLYLPLYFAVAALPVNFNGLGIAQAVAIEFFAPYAEATGDGRAAVFAYTLTASGVSSLLQVAIGIMCLRGSRALGVGSAPVETAETVQEVTTS